MGNKSKYFELEIIFTMLFWLIVLLLLKQLPTLENQQNDTRSNRQIHAPSGADVRVHPRIPYEGASLQNI